MNTQTPIESGIEDGTRDSQVAENGVAMIDNHTFDEIAIGQSATITAAVEAFRDNLIIPVFVGPEVRFLAAADQAGIDVSDFETVGAMHSHDAADRAVALAAAGGVDAIMKGSLGSEELIAAVRRPKNGLRTERRRRATPGLDPKIHPTPLP